MPKPPLTWVPGVQTKPWSERQSHPKPERPGRGRLWVLQSAATQDSRGGSGSGGGNRAGEARGDAEPPALCGRPLRSLACETAREARGSSRLQGESQPDGRAIQRCPSPQGALAGTHEQHWATARKRLRKAGQTPGEDSGLFPRRLGTQFLLPPT